MSPLSQSQGRSASGHGIVYLSLAAVSFVTALFLLLIPVADSVPALLAAAGFVSAGIGLRESDRRPGLAAAGLKHRSSGRSPSAWQCRRSRSCHSLPNSTSTSGARCSGLSGGHMVLLSTRVVKDLA